MPRPILRTCVASRRRFPREELLRLVADHDGRIHADLDGRLPGRGAWVQPQQALVAAIEKRPSRLNRALRRKALDGTGLLADARAQVDRKLISQLQLCRQAGVLVSGRVAVGAADELLGVVLSAQAEVDPWLPELRARLPLTTAELGALVGRGPRAMLGVRPSRPGRRLARWLRWSASLGYPAR